MATRTRAAGISLVPSAVGPPASAGRPWMIVRSRLVMALRGPCDAPLRLVVAPAGYGKTIALAHWADLDPRPFAWVAVGPGHGDRGRLREDVDAALAAVHRRWERGSPPVVLVVDGAESLDEDEGWSVVSRLAESIPDGSLLVVASRCQPALRLGRLRARREVVELGPRDLAMTPAEAGELLARAGLHVDPPHLATLLRRTEGWPAGLSLAAVALAEAPDVAAGVARFHGADRVVAGYLRDEILAALPAADLAFLAGVSPLDELTGPLCDEVLGKAGSGAVLARLARSNVLLTPLDRRGERFRCHPLLREALQAELRHGDGPRELAVHRRASAWHERHGDADRAIAHALAGEDERRAGLLMWRALPARFGARPGDAARWRSALSSDAARSSPEPALAEAALNLARGERDLGERWALIAAAALDAGAADPEVEGGVLLVRAVVARDGVAAMRADAARAFELLPERTAWRALCCLLVGAGDLLMGDRDGRRALADGGRRGALGAPAFQALNLALLAAAALMADERGEGRRLADVARAQAERVGLRACPSCALVYAAAALSEALLGATAEAHRDAHVAQTLLEPVGCATPALAGVAGVVLARARLRLADPRAARAAMRASTAAIGEDPGPRVLRGWLEDTRCRADVAEPAGVEPSRLTAAELRVLHFLPSHLPLRAIAAELSVSPNTVKTQAGALYRKLDASGRSEAVSRAAALGLLDG